MICARTEDDTEKSRCVKLLKELGSLEYTRNFLIFLNDDLKRIITSFGGNPLIEKELDHVMDKLGINVN